MEFTNECRINKELTKILNDHEKRMSAIEGIIRRLETMEAHIDARNSLNETNPLDKAINPLDLNRDGVVDKKDASIAGKVLANRRKKV